MSGTISEKEAVTTRQKYVLAWNRTMIDIWKERITMLGVIDTGALLHSLTALSVRADGRFFEVHLSQRFLEYGLWQNYGVGREVYRGNPGDIGRPKIREARKWFSQKYWSSIMAIKDFMAESIGEEFIGVMSDVFDEDALRRSYGNG